MSFSTRCSTVHLEPLEPRRLFSVTVENLNGPPPAGDPPRGPEEFPITDLTVGGDKYVWYTADKFGSYYPWLIQVNKKGRATDLLNRLADAEDVGPIAAGANGTTYVAATVEGDDFHRGGTFIYGVGGPDDSTYAVVGGGGLIGDLAIAADGNAYFAYYIDNGPEGVYRANKATDLDAELVASPTAHARRMVTGPDGAIWFTEAGARRIGRLTSKGKLTEYKVPSGEAYDIAVGPDGAVWFTEPAANKVGRVDLAGRITEYALPTAGAFPTGITGGPGGVVWFTEPGLRRLASIRTGSGVVKELQLGRSMRGPEWITTGSDGRVYFSRVGGLSRVTITPSTATTSASVSRQVASPSPSPATPFAVAKPASARHLWDDE
jgi:streptogramin lyase